MSKFKLIIATASFTLAVSFMLSCSSDDTEYKIPGMGYCSTKSAFQNSDMVFVKSDIPKGNSAIIGNTWFGSDVLPGGKTSFFVSSGQPLSELYLQISGEDGYYALELTSEHIYSSNEGNYVYNIPLEFSNELGNEQMQVSVGGKTCCHVVPFHL